MARPAGPGRTALLNAGTTLFAQPDGPSLSGMSVNAVVAAAGMSKGAFYQHWEDRSAYLVALHQGFHEELAVRVAAAREGVEPGLARLEAGLYAYLDGCLDAPEARALLLQARSDPALTEVVAARSAQFADMAEEEIVVLGWDPSRPAAELAIALGLHIAGVENLARAPRPDLRATAFALFDRGPKGTVATRTR